MMCLSGSSSGPGCEELVARERGATLLEAAFALALFGSTIALANSILSEEASRQRDVLLGRDLRFMTEASRAFVAGEYETLRAELAFLPDGDAMMEIGMRRIRNDGYLPQAFVGDEGARNSFGQSWRLLARGVDRSDTGRPRTTLALAAIDSDSDNLVDREFVDGNAANGELDLEVILVTTGGETVSARNGNPAIVASGLPVAGFVQETGTARGPHGNWEMDISAFAALDGYPEKGRFTSLIALSGYGVPGLSSSGSGRADAIGNPLDRCPGVVAELLDDCAGNNAMYTDIVFNSPADGWQGIRGDAAAISNLYGLEMGPPVDSDADGMPDMFATITGVSSMTCDRGEPSGLTTGTLIIDCPEAAFSGDVAVEGELSVSGLASASGYIATSIGGQDLVQGIYSAHLVPLDPEPEIAKPDCGSEAGAAAVYTIPVSFISPGGVPLVGVQAYAEDLADPDKWTVRMKAAVSEDRDGDGTADVIELGSASDLVLALTKCE